MMCLHMPLSLTFHSPFLFSSCSRPSVSFFLRRLCFPSSASVNPSLEGETFAWWPSQLFGCLSAPEMVDCWWLAKAGFYILAQSSVNRLMTTNNTLRLHSAFLLRNCECFARVILLIFPTTQWGMKMEKVLAPSFLQRVKSSCLFWGCVTNLHLSFNFIGGWVQGRGVREADLAVLLCLLGQEPTYWISFLQKSTGKWSLVNDQLV